MQVLQTVQNLGVDSRVGAIRRVWRGMDRWNMERNRSRRSMRHAVLCSYLNEIGQYQRQTKAKAFVTVHRKRVVLSRLCCR